MRPDDRADAVVRGLDRRDPVAQRLVDRVLERRAAPTRPGTTSAPSSFMRNTLSAWRSTSTAPMNTMQSSPNSAAAVAVATPCWPAPVSAITRCLPMRRVSSAWPSTLLILCEPVWVRSSRLSSTRTPEPLREPVALGDRRRAGRRSDASSSANSARNSSDVHAVRNSASSSSSAGTSVSGTKRPPNSPKRPRPTGSGPGGSRRTGSPRAGAVIGSCYGHARHAPSAIQSYGAASGSGTHPSPPSCAPAAAGLAR